MARVPSSMRCSGPIEPSLLLQAQGNRQFALPPVLVVRRQWPTLTRRPLFFLASGTASLSPP